MLQIVSYLDLLEELEQPLTMYENLELSIMIYTSEEAGVASISTAREFGVIDGELRRLLKLLNMIAKKVKIFEETVFLWLTIRK